MQGDAVRNKKAFWPEHGVMALFTTTLSYLWWCCQCSCSSSTLFNVGHARCRFGEMDIVLFYAHDLWKLSGSVIIVYNFSFELLIGANMQLLATFLHLLV